MSDEPNSILKILAIFIKPFQDLEDIFQSIRYYMQVDNATGYMLDLIGKRVGERERLGQSNDDYRRRIKARIVVNRSSGLIEEYITICKLVLNDPDAYIRCEQHPHSTMVITVENVAIANTTAAILIRLLDEATPGDQRVVFVYSSQLSENVFRFDSGPGFDQGHLATSVE